MTLKKFLKLHKNGEAQQCVSIKYNGAYLFEEVAQKKIMKSDTLKEIAAKKGFSFLRNIIFGHEITFKR